MSNTIAMSEKIKSYPEAVGWNRGAFWYSGIANLLGANPTVDQAVQECASLSGTPSAFGVHAGGTWYIFGYDHTFYNHTVTPNSRISDCSVQAFRTVSDAYGGVFQATSHHSGGVNCLLMDGSCRFVSNHIDLGIWRAFATRAGGELVGEL